MAGDPPAIDLAAEKRLIDCLVALGSEGIPASAHDISDGGLAVALAESCFAGAAGPEAAPAVGAKVALARETAAEFSLFGERGARAVVSVARAKLAALRSIAGEYGVALAEIGQVTEDASLRIEYEGHAVVDASVKALRDVWANSLERTLFAT